MMRKTLTLSRLIAQLTISLLLLASSHSMAQEIGRGTPFFLLSDATFGSDEIATVRIEAQDLGPIYDQGGVDVYVYKIRKPLEFLKAQKNLHRIDVEGDYEGPGLSNSLSRIWDNWWIGSRKAWRGLFSVDARQAVTDAVPDVRSHPLLNDSTPQTLDPQYRPLKMHTLVDSFRYPVQIAKQIEPPAGMKLEGSSSNFIGSTPGNVMIPVGKREPGLYLVEAMVGDHRAVTIVFISDSIAITKVSPKQMLVWVAGRSNGKPVSDARTIWSDGVGVLASASTDSNGLVTFKHAAPEKSYLYGEDAQGGVYVAENFYYDSEIYNTKMYAVTDRPLYRPGDTVFVKIVGRNFRSARVSAAVKDGDLKLQVLDANGSVVTNQTLRLSAQRGADTSFALPANAVAGGYEMRFSIRGDAYGAAFRVAEYQKPHFEIHILPEKRDFKTSDELKGTLQLVYPNGKPVVNAKAELSVRAQRMTMVEGDLGYSGQFPLQLTTASITTDAKGMASFILPAAAEPSRYIVSVLATDGAAYRVRATKEILVERGAGTYAVNSDRSFSEPRVSVVFTSVLLNDARVPGSASQVLLPATWESVRLENRQRDSGTVGTDGAFSIAFVDPGTYTITLRDMAGNIVGATSHYVSGGGVKAAQGSIEMVFDKSSYRPGETASALITFPVKVDQALLTLERDSVEKVTLMAGKESADWIRVKRISSTQWRAQMPVKNNYGPNITLSALYVSGGEYVFQNLGLKVEQARIEIAMHADKPVYGPGDMVQLDLSATAGGKPAGGAQLSVGVVDEMVYVLQPEIAPNILDFFYHPRRNNVRTTASLNFIAYDLAKPPSKLGLPARGQSHERATKLLERPRREDVDTAYWQPSVTADANGHAHVSFRMPDSLTRWRVTVRGMDAAGLVGQNTSYLLSEKDFYLKWTSPNWLRLQDQPVASIAIFNQSNVESTVELSANGAGLKQRTAIRLKPGANFVSLPLAVTGTDARVDLGLYVNGKPVDALTVPLKVEALHWQSRRSQSVALTAQKTELKLPADATHVSLEFTDSANAQFHRLMDDLIDYPYGCVEQTSSRLIPYSLALQSTLPGDEALSAQMSQQLYSYRLHLAQLAGPQATFGWWSRPAQDQDVDALLTAYAYYADWHASSALKLNLPPDHFERLIEVYRTNGVKRSPWHRALILNWMQEMNLPVRSMAEGLLDELMANQTVSATPVKPVRYTTRDSMVLGQDVELQTAMAKVLAAYVVQQSKGKLNPAYSASLDNSAQRLQQARLPLASALLMMSGRQPVTEMTDVLDTVRQDQPTMDRSLTLLWSYRALKDNASGGIDKIMRASVGKFALEAPWKTVATTTGQQLFRWPDGVQAPSAIALTSVPATGLTAIAQFDSAEPETSNLPVHLERRLYRLIPDEVNAATGKSISSAELTTFKLELLRPDAVLKTDEVYLDEVVLQQSAAPMRFGIVEVALPPGASADRTTWGIVLRYPGSKEASALELAQYEQTASGYAVPVDTLRGEMVIRHLLRFAQPGKFRLPPARYYRMYQPEQKAFEEKFRAYVEIR